MTVYVVTCGSYSDYHIEGVFSTKEKAQEFIDKSVETDRFSYNYAEIEEWPLDEKSSYILHTTWTCWINIETGDIVRETSYTDLEPDIPVEDIDVEREVVRVRSTKSAEHARKLAVEKRQSVLRNGVA